MGPKGCALVRFLIIKKTIYLFWCEGRIVGVPVIVRVGMGEVNFGGKVLMGCMLLDLVVLSHGGKVTCGVGYVAGVAMGLRRVTWWVMLWGLL